MTRSPNLRGLAASTLVMGLGMADEARPYTIVDHLSLEGSLAMASQCEFVAGAGGRDNCGGAASFMPQLSYTPTSQDQILVNQGQTTIISTYRRKEKNVVCALLRLITPLFFAASRGQSGTGVNRGQTTIISIHRRKEKPWSVPYYSYYSRT